MQGDATRGVIRTIFSDPAFQLPTAVRLTGNSYLVANTHFTVLQQPDGSWTLGPATNPPWDIARVSRPDWLWAT